MEQRYSIILSIFLVFSCAKEDLVEDDIIDNPVIQNEWLTFSERYSTVNETTAYFKNQEYFERYLSQAFIDNILGSYREGNCSYKVFNKNSVVTDIDGDLLPDVVAFANSICEGQPFSSSNGKFVVLRDYKSNTQIKVYDAEYTQGNAKMDVGKFLNKKGNQVLFQTHETKTNLVVEEENDFGGFSDNAPKSPSILYWENGLKVKKVGIVMDSHSGTSGDIDNDGDVDFIQFPIPGFWSVEDTYKPPSLAVNSGTDEFTSIDLITDLSERWYSTATELFDINQDGNLDLIVGWRIGTIKEQVNSGDITNTISGPVILYGNGTGTFSISNSITLTENTLTNKGFQAGILGYAFTDYDLDGDIDIVVSTTREEPGGNFNDGTYYDNYHLIFYKNEAGTFIDSTTLINSDNSNDVPNFYFLRTIDKDNDGDYDLVPDGWANFGKYYGPNIHWVNQDGMFIRNN